MWARPGEWRDPLLDGAAADRSSFAPAMGRRDPAGAARAARRSRGAIPSKPHWYLAVLGTDPERQGEGIGRRVLRPVLEECDRLEMPAYLETGTERNVAFYTRHGFRVTDEVGCRTGR